MFFGKNIFGVKKNQKKSSDREIVNEHVSPSGGSGGASSSKIESVEILAALGFGFTMLFYGFDAVNTFNTDIKGIILGNKSDKF